MHFIAGAVALGRRAYGYRLRGDDYLGAGGGGDVVRVIIDDGGQMLRHACEIVASGRSVGRERVGVAVVLVGVGVEIHRVVLARHDRAGQREGRLVRLSRGRAAVEQRPAAAIKGLDALAVEHRDGFAGQHAGRDRAILVVYHEHVAAGLVVDAAVDDQAALDVGNRVIGRGLEGENGRVHFDHRRRDDARLGQYLMADGVADFGRLVGDVDHRIPEQPPMTAADLLYVRDDGLFDDVGKAAVADEMESRVLGDLPDIPVGEVDDDLGDGPRLDLREPAPDDVPPVVARVIGLHRPDPDFLHQQRRILHGEGRRLVLECRRIEHLRRRLAAQVDDVVVAAAAHRDFHVRGRTQHVNLVLAAAAVDLQALDEREVDDAAGAGDIVLGDDELVVDRRAIDHQRIDAVTAVDEHRRVLHVFVAVRALAAEQPREIGDLVGLVGVLFQREKSIDDERVIVVAAGQVQRGDVVVHLELVVLRAAEDVHVEAVAVGHVLRVGDGNAFGKLEVLVALVGNLRHGADHHAVIAPAQLDDGDDGGIVAQDGVVAIHGADRHPLDVAVEDGVALRVGAADCALQAARHVEQLIPQLRGIAVRNPVH